ncbi:MAG: NADPH:quinone oxidoreductase family protein [Ruegeria sp.]
MQAFRVETKGQPAQLRETQEAPLNDNQVRIAIRACGLNFADLLMQKGTYQDTPDTPFTLGMEIAGIVVEIGNNVTNLKLGDRVAVYSGQGGLAESGVFDADRAVPLPETMSFEDAAAIQIAYGTSHIALEHRARLQPGETLLVTGAAGGVGLTAVEIGKLMGATVIAQARGQDKLAVAKNAGADHLIDADEDLRARVRALGGADVVYDVIGGDVFKAAFGATNPEGRLLPIGFAGGEVPQIPANHLLVKNLSVIGVYIGGYLKFRPAIVRDSFSTLFRWHSERQIKPHISHVLPLQDAAKGLELLRDRKSTGKVVIQISSPL